MAHVPGTVSTRELLGHLDDLLRPSVIKDYSPNGLQVEGKALVSRIICAVTATQNVIDAAVAEGADALLVHHGYFWKGEDPRVIGIRRRRLASLLRADINLLAYHLPLDVHPVYGHNVQLGELFGWPVQGWGGEVVGSQGIVGWHDLAEESALDAVAVAERLTERLHREPLLVGDLSRPIRRIAWCSGGAQDFLQDAIDLGADCYISGEISERTTHLAREAGVVYAAAGHHATERCGVQALGAKFIGLSAPRAAGGVAGFLGQPAVLQAADARVTDERIEAAYATLFAFAIIVKILLLPAITSFL